MSIASQRETKGQTDRGACRQREIERDRERKKERDRERGEERGRGREKGSDSRASLFPFPSLALSSFFVPVEHALSPSCLSCRTSCRVQRTPLMLCCRTSRLRSCPFPWRQDKSRPAPPPTAPPLAGSPSVNTGASSPSAHHFLPVHNKNMSTNCNHQHATQIAIASKIYACRKCNFALT